MTLAVIINSLLCLAVLIAIVGSHAWAIVVSHRAEHSSSSERPPIAVAEEFVLRDVAHEDRELAITQP